MNWSSLSDFIDMSGHGPYVWGSFVLVAAAWFWECLMLVQRRRRVLEDLRERALYPWTRR